MVPNPVIPGWCRGLATACFQHPACCEPRRWRRGGRGGKPWWSWLSSRGAGSNASGGEMSVRTTAGRWHRPCSIPAESGGRGDTASVTCPAARWPRGSSGDEQTLRQLGRAIRNLPSPPPVGFPGVGGTPGCSREWGAGGGSPQHGDTHSAALQEEGKGNFSLPSLLRAATWLPGKWGPPAQVPSCHHTPCPPRACRCTPLPAG